MQPPDYVGSGIAFPLDINLQGSLKLSSLDDSVRESIHLILQTSFGERVYRPDFGSRLSELVFRPMNRETLLDIRLCVEEAIERWEPRVILQSVTAEPDPMRGLVALTITYRLRDSADLYDTRSLVYPFYLEPQSSPSP